MRLWCNVVEKYFVDVWYCDGGVGNVGDWLNIVFIIGFFFGDEKLIIVFKVRCKLRK